ncbi:MAG: archease [Methylococcaceae bacterium]|nr:archease [Methylococcaceae bacterium]
MKINDAAPYWEHFDHDSDIGIRGIGSTLEQAFEQAAIALTAVVTDPDSVAASKAVAIECEAPDSEFLFLDWINDLIYRMAVQDLLFSRFEVSIDGGKLTAKAWGEPVDQRKHRPAVEIKGATFTELRIRQSPDAMWIAQCVVDV